MGKLNQSGSHKFNRDRRDVHAEHSWRIMVKQLLVAEQLVSDMDN